MENGQLRETLEYYRRLGAPGDQNALIALLKEVQADHGGAVPPALVTRIADGYGIRDALLLALIRRIPSLRLSDRHLLEICGGPNCKKHARLAQFAGTLESSRLEVRFVPCMRLCAKGPNIRWDGQLYHGATPELLASLAEKI